MNNKVIVQPAIFQSTLSFSVRVVAPSAIHKAHLCVYDTYNFCASVAPAGMKIGLGTKLAQPFLLLKPEIQLLMGRKLGWGVSWVGFLSQRNPAIWRFFHSSVAFV